MTVATPVGMTPILFFVMPVYQRVELTKLCMDQLRWTCSTINAYGRLHCNAVVIGHEDELLEHARSLDFWVVNRENEPVARKFNDGFEAAHLAGADYVVPCGSDNWIHPLWVTSVKLPDPEEVVCHRQCVVVRSDGRELHELNISYDGGDGIRIFPLELFRSLEFRPAVDHRNRAIDTSIVERLRRFGGWVPNYRYYDWGATEVVGFQSDGFDIQLNEYDGLVEKFGREHAPTPNVWERLAQDYPVDAVERMRAYYASRGAAV